MRTTWLEWLWLIASVVALTYVTANWIRTLRDGRIIRKAYRDKKVARDDYIVAQTNSFTGALRIFATSSLLLNAIVYAATIGALSPDERAFTQTVQLFAGLTVAVTAWMVRRRRREVEKGSHTP